MKFVDPSADRQHPPVNFESISFAGRWALQTEIDSKAIVPIFDIKFSPLEENTSVHFSFTSWEQFLAFRKLWDVQIPPKEEKGSISFLEKKKDKKPFRALGMIVVTTMIVRILKYFKRKI